MIYGKETVNSSATMARPLPEFSEKVKAVVSPTVADVLSENVLIGQSTV